MQTNPLPAEWTEDIVLSSANPLVRAKLHGSSSDGCSNYSDHDQLRHVLGVKHPAGTQVSMMFLPYLITTHYPGTIRSYLTWLCKCAAWQLVPRPKPAMVADQFGHATVWYFPKDRLIAIWDCYGIASTRMNLHKDPLLTGVWIGLERFLVKRFPVAKRIVTPSWDPDYETHAFQAFLMRLGYPMANSLWASRYLFPV